MASAAFLNPDVPTEIYLAITDYLPLSSIVALTLTSKRLAHVYGIQVRDDLQAYPNERRDFFLLLEKDMPGYYLASAINAKLTH